MEALYAICADLAGPEGGIGISGDKDKGHRYNEASGVSIKGVYTHMKRDKKHLDSYMRFAPVFNDGTYVRCYFELLSDRCYRVKYKHDTQRVQEPNTMGSRLTELRGGPSVFYKSLWVQSCRIRNSPTGRTAPWSGAPQWRRDQRM